MGNIWKIWIDPCLYKNDHKGVLWWQNCHVKSTTSINPLFVLKANSLASFRTLYGKNSWAHNTLLYIFYFLQLSNYQDCFHFLLMCSLLIYIYFSFTFFFQGEVTYTPRLILIDSKDNVRSIRQECPLYRYPDEKDPLWYGI